MTIVLRREEKGRNHGGKDDVKMEVEVRVMLSTRTPRVASSYQNLGERNGTDSTSEPPEGINPDFELQVLKL